MTTPIHQSSESAPRWTAQTVGMSVDILDRMERAVAKVRERLLRATAALNKIGVPYAVVGGNAVASWVATVDEGAVRNTRDVDLLVRRIDLPAITAVLVGIGETDHLLFTGEKIRPDHLLAAPEIQTVEDPAKFRVIALDSLVEMLLVSARAEDGMHLRDMICVGLIDASWLPKLPPELAERLQWILDTPDA